MTEATVVSAGRGRLLYGAQRLLEDMTGEDRPGHPVPPSRPSRDRTTMERHYLTTCITLRLVMIMVAENVQTDALSKLRQTLIHAASTGFDQIFQEAGPEVSAVLADLGISRRLRGTLERTLTGAGEFIGQWNAAQKTAARRQKPDTDPLSRREVVVVELIGHGHSNKEIARRLGIAPETVKTHVKKIFSKLGVVKRAQAVSRAHALGLVSEHASASIPDIAA
jgi:LuxR family transcriptional regulator, maltose regulon positive regulatory protein